MSLTRHSAPVRSGTASDLRADFIAAMGSVATGVTVVGTDGPDGRFAQTVSAMCSVCADPPTLLVCVNHRSPITDAIASHEAFSVNVLATRHDHVADTFAGRPWPGKERWDFSCGDWGTGPSGQPRLTDALAWFDCELTESVTAGTHHVYIGRVSDVAAAAGAPLVYAGREYGRPEPVEPSRFPDFPEAHPDNRMRNNA